VSEHRDDNDAREQPEGQQQPAHPLPDDQPRWPTVQRRGHQRAGEREHHAHRREHHAEPAGVRRVIADHADEGDRPQRVEVAVAAIRHGRHGKVFDHHP
jgi:hypothetical protein